MKPYKKFSTYLKEQLKNEEFREAFEEEGVYAELAIQIAQLRQTKGYTQQDLARLLRTTQQTISRLEDPKNGSLSVKTLVRMANLFKKNLRIQFI